MTNRHVKLTDSYSTCNNAWWLYFLNHIEITDPLDPRSSFHVTRHHSFVLSLCLSAAVPPV